MRYLLVTWMIFGLVAATAPVASAAPADVYRQRDSLSGTFTALNICDWTATFTARGFSNFSVVDTSSSIERYTYHETVNYSLVISDDPSVPEAYPGSDLAGAERRDGGRFVRPARQQGTLHQGEPFL